MRCDYCWHVVPPCSIWKPGDVCPKCGKGHMCPKGSGGNP